MNQRGEGAVAGDERVDTRRAREGDEIVVFWSARDGRPRFGSVGDEVGESIDGLDEPGRLAVRDPSPVRTSQDVVELSHEERRHDEPPPLRGGRANQLRRNPLRRYRRCNEGFDVRDPRQEACYARASRSALIA